MDPVVLSAAATSLITMFLTKAIEKAGEEVGVQVSKKISDLWEFVRSRFQTKPLAEAISSQLESKPQDVTTQEMFKLQLKQLIEEDADFRNQLSEIFRDIEQIPETQKLLNIGSGSIATDKGVAAGEKGVAIRGNVKGNVNTGSDTDNK